jgi:hypothetical protein
VIQLYPSSYQSRGSEQKRFDYATSLIIEAGCLQAALNEGLQVIAWRVATNKQTEQTIIYRFDSIDAVQVGRRTGADAVISGSGQLTPESHRIAELHLKVEGGNSGQLEAEADLKDDDGADPFEAGQHLCSALLRGWNR